MFYVHEDHLANLSKHRFWCNYSWVGTEIFLTSRRHHALKSMFLDLHYITLYCLSKCYGLAHRSMASCRPELLPCTQGNWAIRWDTKYTLQIKTYPFAFYSSARTFLSWGLGPNFTLKYILGWWWQRRVQASMCCGHSQKGWFIRRWVAGVGVVMLCWTLFTFCEDASVCPWRPPPWVEWNCLAMGFLLSFFTPKTWNEAFFSSLIEYDFLFNTREMKEFYCSTENS